MLKIQPDPLPDAGIGSGRRAWVSNLDTKSFIGLRFEPANFGVKNSGVSLNSTASV
jgi:hypothetical protein